MKKWIMLLLALVLAASCTACDAVENVEDAIDGIGYVTPDSQEEIENAASLFYGLNLVEQLMVSNADELMEAQETYAQMKASVDEVSASIEAIGAVTLESKEAIDKAAACYEALPGELRPYVDAGTLTWAKERYTALVTRLEEAKAAIDAIGAVTPESGDAVKNARKRYNELEGYGLLPYMEDYGAVLTRAEADYREACFDAAQALFDAGDHRGVLDAGKQLREEYPSDPRMAEYLRNASVCCVKLGEQALAVEDLESALGYLEMCSGYDTTIYTDEAYLQLQARVTEALERIRPANNAVLYNSLGSGYGKFTVEAGEYDACAKLVSNADPEKYVLFFVYANESATVSVPDGSYTLKYAEGGRWFGQNVLFGTGTMYTTIEDSMDFATLYDASYVYYDLISVTLYTVVGGNLTSTEISADDF